MLRVRTVALNVPYSFPPDPIRYVGAHVVRTGVAAKEAKEAVGQQPSRVSEFLAGLAPGGMIPKKGKPKS